MNWDADHFGLKLPFSVKDMNAMSQLGQSQTHSFEDAVGELENIIAQMEDGKMTLDDTLKHYKRGTELLKYCQHQLTNAQQQVSILEGDILKPLSETQIES